MKSFSRSLTTVLTLMLCGCESAAYYGQAALGQWHILRDREDIDTVIGRETTSKHIREKLLAAKDARVFARDTLALASAGGYTRYVDIGRPYVVWNVFAAPEFDVNPKTWCFPVAGCVPYRGYFSEKSALQYAEKLQREGYEVHVGGVEAYSTLGWFDDPILSTFLSRREDNLVGLIFHEMSHQHLYVAGDAAFNESYATLIEIEGLRLWRAERDLRSSSEDPDRLLELREHFIRLLMDHRAALKVLYDSPVSNAEKRKGKQRLHQTLIANYSKFKEAHPDAGQRFDGWFTRPVNNARLSSVATYSQWVPAFRQLLRECKHDFVCFDKETKRLSDLPFTERNKILESLLPTPGQ